MKMSRPLPRWARQVRVVLVKELVDSFRDKRALSSILLSILVGPLITGFMMNRIADRQKEADEVRVPIVGARNAPALVQWLSQQSGVVVATGPTDPEQAVRDQSEYIVLVVPPGYADDFRSSRPANIKVVADSARSDTRAQVERVQRLLQQYNAEIGAPAPDRARRQPRGRHAAEDPGCGGLHHTAARGQAALRHPVDGAAGGVHRRDAAGHRRHRRRARARVARGAAGQSGAARRAGARQGDRLGTGRHAGRDGDGGLCTALLRFIPLQELGMRFRFGTPHMVGLMAAALRCAC
jgi:hypothetical protein